MNLEKDECLVAQFDCSCHELGLRSLKLSGVCSGSLGTSVRVSQDSTSQRSAAVFPWRVALEVMRIAEGFPARVTRNTQTFQCARSGPVDAPRTAALY